MLSEDKKKKLKIWSLFMSPIQIFGVLATRVPPKPLGTEFEPMTKDDL
jgi:hypothetical protein